VNGGQSDQNLPAQTKKDDLFARPLGDLGGFVFDENVVSVFPDMIKRSVPGYETIITMTGTLAEKYVQENSCCYDLGSSLGASTLAIARSTRNKAKTLIAVDNSAAMVNQCRNMLLQQGMAESIELICADILNVAIGNASMVVLNFTLQFIPVQQRQALVRRIYEGLNPGGILVLSEKVSFADHHLNELMIELHHNFKRANGYSELEISQKRSALENVLIPETLGLHRQRLTDVGFSSVDVWFQCFNFASLIAIKH
jgi:tRNA (cmo5U34)-methyltransferase